MQDRQESQEFRASTSREAFNEIRRVLGPDAIILEQTNVGSDIVIRACAELSEATSPPPEEAVADDRAATSQPAQTADIVYAELAIPTLRGTYRLLGASGVGKTSTLIKIAAEWVLHNAPQDCVVVTTDCERLASTEALHLASQLLGVRLIEAAPTRLDETLARLAHMPLVLIDTPALTSAAHNIRARDFLVISGLHGTRHLERQRALVRHLDGICVTHLDEAGGELAELVQILADWQVPVCWLSHGGALSDPLQPATPGAWAALGATALETGLSVELTV